jgi:hypothetical protein
MNFGKRFSVHNQRPARVIEQTCARCCGTTGRIAMTANRVA